MRLPVCVALASSLRRVSNRALRPARHPPCQEAARCVSRGNSVRKAELDVLGIGFVLFGVATILPFVVDLVLFDVGLIDIVGGHAESLRQ